MQQTGFKLMVILMELHLKKEVAVQSHYQQMERDWPLVHTKQSKAKSELFSLKVLMEPVTTTRHHCSSQAT